VWRFKVCSVEEMRWIDEEASKRGIDHALLMENAGSAVFNLVLRAFGVRDRRFTVIAGTGNNGGDALVAARRIYAHGGYVEVFIVGDPEKYREPARRNYELACKLGIPVRVISSESDLADLEKSLQACDVVVVGLIGIGLRGEVTGLTRLVIEVR
jgi:NAD(P)H-hydrate epimerase